MKCVRKIACAIVASLALVAVTFAELQNVDNDNGLSIPSTLNGIPMQEVVRSDAFTEMCENPEDPCAGYSMMRGTSGATCLDLLLARIYFSGRSGAAEVASLSPYSHWVRGIVAENAEQICALGNAWINRATKDSPLMTTSSTTDSPPTARTTSAPPLADAAAATRRHFVWALPIATFVMIMLVVGVAYAYRCVAKLGRQQTSSGNEDDAVTSNPKGEDAI